MNAHEARPAFHFTAVEGWINDPLGVTWKDVATALFNLRSFVQKRGLWHSIAHDVDIGQDFVDRVREGVEDIYGAWTGA